MLASSLPPTSRPDPRSVDITIRYLLPYPIAALYRLSQVSHEGALRFGASLRLAEGVIRFLALTNLADACTTRSAEGRVREWLRLLRMPGMGKLLGLFRSVTTYLTDAGGPFLAETATLIGGPWEHAADEITQMRNEFVHDDVNISNAEARPRLERLQGPLRELLSGVEFLRHYRLGVTQGLRASGKGFTYFWYAARGLEEACEPVTLRGSVAVTDNLVMLLHAASGRALYLAPFLHWGLSAGDRAMHLFLLNSLAGNHDPRAAVYRHATLRHEIVRGLAEPDESDSGEGATVARFIERRASWPGRMDLGLDQVSLGRLVDPVQPPRFEERYEVIGKRGEGGMGTVWEAHDTLLKRHCALKVLRGEFTRDPGALRRFLREGTVLARVSHRSVVEVYDVGVDSEQRPYITMQLVEGENLHERLLRQGPMDLPEAAGVLREVLGGLQAIHDQGVIHRDIKPSNFILSGESVRVIDFGIASIIDDTRLTKTVDRMGTPEFMAPEQWKGEATPRSDIFAAGRLLFTLLCGRSPQFPDERLRTAAPHIPREVDRVYAKATAPSAADRFPSARAMAEALDAAVELGYARLEDTVPGGPLPLNESEVLQVFERVEQRYPMPLARVVRDIPFRCYGEDRPLDVFTLFLPVEVFVRYSLAIAVAAVGSLGPSVPGSRELAARLYGGSTLGAAVAILEGLSRDLVASGFTPRVPPVAIPMLAHIVNFRNELSTRGGRLSHEEIREGCAFLADLFDAVSFLADEPLHIAGLTPPLALEPGSAGAVTAVGAMPSGWWPERFAAAPGLYVSMMRNASPIVCALSPLARLGPTLDDVLLFVEAHGSSMSFLSTARAELVEMRDATLARDVRAALGVVDGA